MYTYLRGSENMASSIILGKFLLTGIFQVIIMQCWFWSTLDNWIRSPPHESHFLSAIIQVLRLAIPGERESEIIQHSNCVDQVDHGKHVLELHAVGGLVCLAITSDNLFCLFRSTQSCMQMHNGRLIHLCRQIMLLHHCAQANIWCRWAILLSLSNCLAYQCAFCY